MEERLACLRKQHDTLKESYETLQLEYSLAKRVLEGLRNQQDVQTIARLCSPVPGVWEGSEGEILDPLLYSASPLWYDFKGGDRSAVERFM